MLKTTVELAPEDAELHLDDYLPFRLAVAADAVSGLIARAYRDRFGLAIPEWRILCCLAEAPGAAAADILALTAMQSAAVDEAIGAMVRRGLAAPAAGQGLRLTREGERLHAAIAPLALAYEAALSAGLSPREMVYLKRLLARLQTAAGALAGAGPKAPSLR